MLPFQKLRKPSFRRIVLKEEMRPFDALIDPAALPEDPWSIGAT
jgi:hypothetical protein